MNNADTIAAISAGIAGVSLIANAAQAVVLHRMTRKDVAKGELIISLKALLRRLEFSRVFTVDPESEIWALGFESLYELAGLCADAHVTVQHSRDVDPHLRETVSELHDRVKALRALHDSYSQHAHGKDESPVKVQKKWRDLEQAKAMLRSTSPTAEKCKRLISEYLRQNGY